MKKLLSAILLLVCISPLFADTIDYCHIYYNKIKIKEINETQKDQVISLNSKEIKKADIITIRYFYDTPSDDCLTQVIINDKKQNIIVSGKSKGSSNPIDVTVFPLFQKYLQTGEGTYDVFYIDKNEQKNEFKKLIFKIIIE